ncbi:unnamed protein product [Closterium sp. Naga37s-1]|nr:unnamed protein product [Closterium sp. Naga37s-1]
MQAIASASSMEGARSFFRSLDAAIFLFSRVSNIPHRSLVLPCVCTNDRFTLGAELFVTTHPPTHHFLPLVMPLMPPAILTKAATHLFTPSIAYQCSVTHIGPALALHGHAISPSTHSSDLSQFSSNPSIPPLCLCACNRPFPYACWRTTWCGHQDGSIIRGQNDISHPAVVDSPRHLLLSVDKVALLPPPCCNATSARLAAAPHTHTRPPPRLMERASRVLLLPVFLSLFLPAFSLQSCDASPPLPAPIRSVFYMSSEGTNLLHEVFPCVNPRVLEHMASVDAIIYGIGSLFTSICPSLVPTYTPPFLPPPRLHHLCSSPSLLAPVMLSLSLFYANSYPFMSPIFVALTTVPSAIPFPRTLDLATGGRSNRRTSMSQERKALGGITCCGACSPRLPHVRMAWLRRGGARRGLLGA